MGTPLSILLVGGTFDPPHRAHVELPALVAARLGCAHVVYIPAAQSPHKASAPPAATGAQRVEMLRLALRSAPNTSWATLELDRGGASYFVETLEAIRGILGAGVELRFLLGADQALSFGRWRDPDRILELATPAVVLRPPWDAARFAAALRDEIGGEEAARWARWVVPGPMIDINATDVRDRLAEGRSVADVLAPEVIAYIERHGLYGANGTARTDGGGDGV